MLNNNLNNFNPDDKDGKKRKLEIAFDDEIIPDFNSEEPSRKKRLDDSELLIIPFYLQDVFLENVFPFMTGKDLNRIRLVCSCWYNFQRSDYFVTNHIVRLNIKHDILQIEQKKTQLSIVRINLGYKQGNMLIIHIEKGKHSIIEDLIDEHVNDPNCSKFIDNTIISKLGATSIKSIVGYKDGKKHGETIDYFKTGQIMQIGHFENGKKHGDFIKYFNSPYVVERTYSYKNDKLFGKLVENKIIYSKNQKVVVKDVECHYENGKYHGEKIIYEGKDSTITEISNFKNGKRHGISKHYHYSGDPNSYYLKGESNYQDGKIHGVCKSFYANGEPFTIIEYENGHLISETINSSEKRKPVISQLGFLIKSDD
ncbi:COG2849 domain-containing protein [Naegleria gruberi]|uniref:COG2849 domain-containing protein n=1 Tax=Naegleria gruberi TaxID=5762 RepID=D2VAQ0_NAEGR|nr:COG2849 domain-containing protein [Naegleria gruberi]EFC46116.1 COG2849 domain-containing protein [Naegleria gruberi]|eukprot:XP_002678860.1 COG2849 domain-containing protein [Naegleria gruberi strain NEG-M]